MYYLQRQQLAVAQEIFREAPHLNKQQKALILAFMAGSRGTCTCICFHEEEGEGVGYEGVICMYMYIHVTINTFCI